MIRRFIAGLVCLVVLAPQTGRAALGPPATGSTPLFQGDLNEWLTYIASDELKGRATFSEGLGLAAQYLQSHLREWQVTPAGDAGGYLQTVRVLGVQATSRSTVTVRVGGQTRTFKDGENVLFPRLAGRKRAVTFDRVEFVGYGLDAPWVPRQEIAGKDEAGPLAVWLAGGEAKSADPEEDWRLQGLSRLLLDQHHAGGSIGLVPPAGPMPGRESGGARRAAPRVTDFTTSSRLDLAPSLAATASDPFFAFLFSKAPVAYDELKRKAAAQEPLPSFSLPGVSLTFNVDVDYRIVRTELTQNVVGSIEGTDPRLKHTYVAFGAHYDHVGYAESELSSDGRRQGAPGKITPSFEADRIWNGADDDGSGTVALMALAKAFARGPRPRRSLLFVWHAGEERGLLGSRYFVDHPTVPIDAIVAQLNIDMIGRNRDDKASESNTVYIVGADRISSELDALNREANRALPQPLTLDYALNDPTDADQFYVRSDHYSYAAKGIPVIFFTTGLHPDYHANTDEVSKILFDKMSRIVQLVYETGLRAANLPHPPVRDNHGPRAGKGTSE